MTLGLECIKFMLEQDPANLPIVQNWIDKWFWRGYRVLTLVGMMMDYMLPKRVMSWKEAWEIYVEQNGGALFDDLARYGIRVPKWLAAGLRRQGPHRRTRPGPPSTSTAPRRAFHTWMPKRRRDGLAVGEVPQHLRQVLPAALRALAPSSTRKASASTTGTLPQLCQVCQIPMLFTEPGDPTKICYRESRLQGRQVPLLLRRLQGHLRQRAGEVRPGLAAGAPDLPGQLLRPRHRPDRAGLRPAARGAQVLPPQPSAATTSTSRARKTRRTSPPGAKWPPRTKDNEEISTCRSLP